MACVALALFGSIREFGEEAPSSRPPEPFVRDGVVQNSEGSNAQQDLAPFREEPGVFERIQDDDLLETEAFYYLLHRCLSDKEPLESTVTWDDLRDFDRRESSRGMRMSVRGAVAGARIFRLGESGDCYRFHPRDIDFAQIAASLRDGEDPAARHIVSLLADTDLPELLNQYNAFLPPSEKLKKSLLEQLDGLLENPLLYQAEFFTQPRVSAEIRSVFEGAPREKDLVRANRRLLAEAFPGKLSTSRDASSFGLEGFPAWLACVDTDEAGACLAVLTEMPENVRQGDGVEFSACFFKLWRYPNRQGEGTHSCVFVGKTLRVLPEEPPVSVRRVEWYIFGLLLGIGFLLFGAAWLDRREKGGVRLRLRAERVRRLGPK